MKVKSNIIINFTSCDFTKYVYGTEKYILDNINELEQNVDIISIIPFPSKQSKLYSKFLRSFQLLKNKEEIGIISFNELVSLLYLIKENDEVYKSIVIQNIIEYEFYEIDKIINIFQHDTIYIHLHEYSLICKSYNLINSENEFCNVDGCGKCKYHKERYKLYEFVNSFSTEKLMFISPSNYTKNIFCKVYPRFRNRTVVIPHDKYCFETKEKSFETIRIGYIGAQLEVKGWNDFKIFSNHVKNKFEMYYLGHGSEKLDGVKNIEVGKNGQFNMCNAIKENNINIAFLGSICPETFSYTLFEAMQNGCFVLCNDLSGNIADVVRKYNNGYVYKTIDELIMYINSKDFINTVNKNLTVYALNKKKNYYFLDKYNTNYVNVEINFKAKYKISSKVIRALQRLK